MAAIALLCGEVVDRAAMRTGGQVHDGAAGHAKLGVCGIGMLAIRAFTE